MAARNRPKAAESLLAARPLSRQGRYDLSLFAGRSKPLALARKALDHRYNVLVSGPYGSGKTSFLNKLIVKAERRCGVLPIPCDRVPYATTAEEILDAFLHALLRVAVERDDVSGPQIDAIARDVGKSFIATTLPPGDPATERSAKLDHKYAALRLLAEAVAEVTASGTHAVFFVDEFPPDPELFVEMFGRYRDYLWDLDANFIVTWPADLLERVLRPPVTSFFDLDIRLGPLTRAETETMLRARGVGQAFLQDRGCLILHRAANGIPRKILELARDVELGLVRLDELAERSEARQRVEQGLPKHEEAVYRYLRTAGPVSASDPKFQAATGLHRTRLTTILRALVSKNLVVAHKEGRAVLYRLADPSTPQQAVTEAEGAA